MPRLDSIGRWTLSRALRDQLRCAQAIVLLISAMIFSVDAAAVPSFGVQTDQPCAACHIGSFGPRLKQAGRDFKLFGYSATDNKNHGLPLNLNVRGSFTHTDADQTGGASPGFDVNDNVAFDGLTFSYAGLVANKIGAIARLAYNGVQESWAWGGVDVRYTDETKLFGRDTVFGLSLNNTPTRTDVWDATSGSPSNSGLAPSPKASPIAGKLSGLVAGGSVYGLWDDLVYVEGSLYASISRDALNALGKSPLNGTDSFDGPVSFARFALQHEWDEGRHYLQGGISVLNASMFPGDKKFAGNNSFTDVQFDATYQYIVDPKLSTSDMAAIRVSYVVEHADLAASHIISGTNAADDLTVLKMDAAYSVDATWTTTAQYFQTTGDRDFARWKTPLGAIDTRGWSLQLEYSPWGKPESYFENWLNLRVTAQYTNYDQFNGTSVNASDRNAFTVGIAIGGASSR